MPCSGPEAGSANLPATTRWFQRLRPLEMVELKVSPPNRFDLDPCKVLVVDRWLPLTRGPSRQPYSNLYNSPSLCPALLSSLFLCISACVHPASSMKGDFPTSCSRKSSSRAVEDQYLIPCPLTWPLCFACFDAYPFLDLSPRHTESHISQTEAQLLRLLFLGDHILFYRW